MKRGKIPTIVGIIILIVGIAASVLLVQSRQIFRLGAAPEYAPKDVRVTNITGSSFTVSWMTDKKTEAFIKWGKGSSSLTTIAKDEIQGESFIHTVAVSDLLSQTTYSFLINSGGTDFDNNGLAWEVSIGPSFPSAPGSNLISGSILTATGKPAAKVLVYVNLAGASPLSTTTSQNGSWLINIASVRTSGLTSFLQIIDTNTLIEITVAAGPQGFASAQIYPASAKPTPVIILGQIHDFKNLPPSKESAMPTATVELPSGATLSSGLEVTGQVLTASTETVSLDSLEEGEIISSADPEFSGTGPVGKSLTITIESETVSGEVTVNSFGNWRWSPPRELSPGTHKITVSLRDASGVLRILTRTFVVQAAEENPAPTPTPSPTPSPIPVFTVTSTPSPEILGSSSLTPTIALSIIGLSLIVSGGLLAIMALTEKYARPR